MARFRGEVTGQRGTASRLGSTNSGIRAHIRGWHVGVRVGGYVADGVDGKPTPDDVFRIFATGGSAAALSDLEIGTVTRKGDALVFVPARKAGR